MINVTIPLNVIRRVNYFLRSPLWHLKIHKKRLCTSIVISQLNPSCYRTTELEIMRKSLDVGIVAFVGDHPKVTAVVKYRSSDFHVHEIDSSGKRIHLTDLCPPKDRHFAEPYYTHCTLYKADLAWIEALNYLSRKLRIHPRRISIVGMKDKVAKSSQRICFANVDADRLIELSGQSEKIKLGNFLYSLYPLKTAALKGNHFKILLRNVESKNKTSVVTVDFQRAVQSLKTLGFINYFGFQRFASEAHVVGIAMLQRNWDKVFDLILKPKKDDPEFLVRAKSVWLSTRDTVQIAKLLETKIGGRYYNSVEVSLLRGLVRDYNGTNRDAMRAFNAIPPSIRIIYYSALKSFLWNHIATFRMQKFGLKPVPGDVVLVHDAVNNYQSDDDTPMDSPTNKNEGMLKVLIEEDIEGGRYSIHDVFLLIPDVEMCKYPNKEIQDYYEQLLKENELDTDCFVAFRNIYFPGDVRPLHYRSLVVKPTNFDCKLLSYGNEDELRSLIPSDLDLLMNKDSAKTDSPETSSYLVSPNVAVSGKDKTCAVLEFSLPPSTYATMAFRELLDVSEDNFQAT